MPRSLTSPPRFVRVFLFLPQAFLQGESRPTGVPSPCVLVWSPTQRQTADLTVFKPLFQVVLAMLEYEHTHTTLEAPCLWFMLLPFISLRVGEDGVTKCTPRVWQFKEKIHPQIVIRCFDLICLRCSIWWRSVLLEPVFPRWLLRVKCPYCLCLTSNPWEEE